MIKKLKNWHQMRGALLSEIVLGVSIIGLSILFLASLPGSILLNSRTSHASLARDIANKQVDYLRKKTYINLINTTTPVAFTDFDLAKLSSGTGGYTIEDCQPPICLMSEQVKLVRVAVTWREKDKDESVEFTTLVAKGGLAN